EPVTLVGRHPPGAGMRLGDVTLLLEDGHLVTDRCRRHSQVMPLGQRLGPDWLLSGHVVLHDGTQPSKLAIGQHARLQPSIYAPFTVANAPRGQPTRDTPGQTGTLPF